PAGPRGDLGGALLERGPRLALLADVDDPARRRENRREQVRLRGGAGLEAGAGHTAAPAADSSAVEIATSLSSVRRASPRSIARDALTMPSSTDAVAPATKSAA